MLTAVAFAEIPSNVMLTLPAVRLSDSPEQLVEVRSSSLTRAVHILTRSPLREI